MTSSKGSDLPSRYVPHPAETYLPGGSFTVLDGKSVPASAHQQLPKSFISYSSSVAPSGALRRPGLKLGMHGVGGPTQRSSSLGIWRLAKLLTNPRRYGKDLRQGLLCIVASANWSPPASVSLLVKRGAGRGRIPQAPKADPLGMSKAEVSLLRKVLRSQYDKLPGL